MTGEGVRSGNSYFCGDVIFEWPPTNYMQTNIMADVVLGTTGTELGQMSR